MMRSGWNLPPGVTPAMIDEHMGAGQDSEDFCDRCDEWVGFKNLEELVWGNDAEYLCRSCHEIRKEERDL